MFVLLFLTKSTLPSSGSTEVRKHFHSPTVAFEACYASITLTTSSFQSNLQIDSVNRRQYGRSSQSSLKIPSSNLEQSLHLASPPSATLTFPPLLTALSLLFLTPPTPTPILTLQTTFTTPTLLHQPQPLSPLSHPLCPPNNYAWKRQKKPCFHKIRSLHHNNFNHLIYQHIRTYYLSQEIVFQKDKTIRPDHHPKETPTYSQSIYFH